MMEIIEKLRAQHDRNSVGSVRFGLTPESDYCRHEPEQCDLTRPGHREQRDADEAEYETYRSWLDMELGPGRVLSV